jgi:S1/P1 Nuclease
MNRLRLTVAAILSTVAAVPLQVAAWNAPAHMVTGAIAYRLLENESPRAVSVIKRLLEKHPWYADRWRDDVEKLPESQRGEMLFMLVARWADDIRMQAKLQREVKWHYINFPFKPAGEPEDIKPLSPDPDNILSALAENRRIVKSQVSADKRAIAVAWIFHLVGDVHQPLHTVQLFSREYPHGDRGGNEVCIRLAQERAPLDLHRLWDGVITSTKNIDYLRKIATELLSKFSRVGLRELDQKQPEAWAKESYEIAVNNAYENGNVRGTPKGQAWDCRDVSDANFISRGYPGIAKLIADRRIYLAGYRIAELLQRITSE